MEYISPSVSNRPTWAAINLKALINNYKLIKQEVGPKTEVMAMVKANAYGHGAVAIALELEKAGGKWFGVATPEEGVELRKAGVKGSILSMGGFWKGQEKDIINYEISPIIYRTDMLNILDKTAKEFGKILSVHIKIDSGMGRLGISLSQVLEIIHKIKECSSIKLEGLMTHFAAAGELDKNDFTNQQISIYEQALSLFIKEGLVPKFRHLSNSAATCVYPNARGCMVRVGGLLYGIARDLVSLEFPLLPVSPVLTLHSKVTLLKNVPAGQPLGYGCTFTTQRPSKIATLPIGYGDGLSRAHSNCGHAIVRGIKVPIIGRVSMDFTLIDVTDVEQVKLGDVATFIGSQGSTTITAEEYAANINTIALEATTIISARVLREYIS